jgi:Ca2+-binding EF-hand superfamily protein
VEKHEKALQETQLVKVKNKETLEGKVDIPKVREIRRAIRRRYGNRTNFHRIFNSWDRHRKGYIDLSDLHYMVNQLGIKMNAQETKVLMASHDLSGNKKLTMEEFMDMVFSPNDNMNVDLSKIPYAGGVMEIEPNEDIMRGIQKDAMQLKKIKEENQLKYMLQKSLHELHKELQDADKEKTSEVDFPAFSKAVLEKVQLPTYMRERTDLLQAVFSDFESKHPGRMNYRRFADSIKAFQYMGETDLNMDLGPATNPSGSAMPPSGAESPAKPEQRLEKRPMVLQDVQKVPANQRELIVERTLKVSRLLQAKFGSADKFEQELKDKLKFDAYGNVSAHDLEQYLVDVCKPHLVKREVGRRDLEGFLSSLLYNKYRMTNGHGLAPYVFSDDTEISKKIHTVARPMPPPASIAEKFTDKAPEAGVAAPEGEQEGSPTRMRELLKELQQKSFADKKYIYHVFKDYDRDCDGTILSMICRLRFV